LVNINPLSRTKEDAVAPHEVDGRIPLRWICATVPAGDDYELLDDLNSPAACRRLEHAARDHQPIWLELGIPEHDEIRATLAERESEDVDVWAQRAQDWLQGTLDAWVKMPVPIVDWSNVAPVLKAIGLPAPQTPTNRTAQPEIRFLEALPHLYGRGVARTERELLGGGGSLDATLLFPTVGFLPDDTEPDPTPEFWTVRASVGVIRNLVITVRLPDALCSGERSPDYRSGVARLGVKKRYLPFGRDADEQDIAEGIGIYQAATLQAVVETIREQLGRFESGSRDLVASAGSRDRDAEGESPIHELEDRLEGVVTLTETAHQLDRHVASVLRRFGDSGKENDQLVPRDIRLRYGFAIDQLTSLREELRLARTALSDRISAAEQKAREQFQGLAALIASAILVPGLIAAVYSTDVKLPAEESWTGFAMLLLLIIGLALFGLWAVIRLQPHADVVRINDGIKRAMAPAAAGAVAAGVAVAVFVPMF